MKIIGVIPARYASSRFPGKPLADICGKPMIWWAYQQAIKAEGLDSVVIATDHPEIHAVCRDLGMEAILTKDTHASGVERLSEVAAAVEADRYILAKVTNH